MMYDPEYTRQFYNTYGDTEWNRLERDAYGRLQAIIHEDHLLRYVRPGYEVLDAGSGPGRFSIIAARAGARVTVQDISDTQLETAREKIEEAGMQSAVSGYSRGDICDLSEFRDDFFDLTLCFGGALSYACEKRQQAANELVRVTKPGGMILVSVMSLLGSAMSSVTIPDMMMLNNPDKTVDRIPALWPILASGDLPPFPSHAGVDHAAMHLYTAVELRDLFTRCEMMETAGSNVCLREYTVNGNQISESPTAWNTLVELEKKLNHDPGLVNSGSHIIMAIRKPASD